MHNNPIIGKMTDNVTVVDTSGDGDDLHECMDSMHISSHNDASINDVYSLPVPSTQTCFCMKVCI